MKIASYFPSRLLRWFLSRQIFFSSILFIFLNGILLLWLEKSGHEREIIELARQVVLVSLALAFGTMITVSIFMARKLVVPLGRLIEKTRRLREFPFESEEMEPEALTFEEPGEWYELERALNRLGRDLRQKTIRLSREKTEMRAIMSAVSEAVLAISAERRVLFYNPQFAYLFNPISVDGELRISEVLRSPDVLEVYSAALKSGVTERRELQLDVLVESQPRIFELSVAPLKAKHNQEVYGAVGIFYDITELKQAERIRIEFVGNVSHELRTPLTAINGFLQTLTEDVKSKRLDQAEHFLGIVGQNVKRLKNLVDDLLDLSTLESGKDLQFEVVDVRDITEGVMKQVNSRAHKIHLSYDVEQMEADPKRLEQVLRNLMENAVRYVPEGGNIEVNWRKGKEGKGVRLQVKDDGPGIAPEHQSRLFERFYRVDEARSRETGGTGIGLSLVKHIVQRHGGQVFVRSQPGRGAEFICDFPDRI
jgi:two-component system, OmpR family, phosphate regulon sensor histidine kinase PhoR